jgi:hypothetical protein
MLIERLRSQFFGNEPIGQFGDGTTDHSKFICQHAVILKHFTEYNPLCHGRIAGRELTAEGMGHLVQYEAQPVAEMRFNRTDGTTVSLHPTTVTGRIKTSHDWSK